MSNTPGKPAVARASAPSTIAPWLTITDCYGAVAFYTAAFGAEETYRMETPDGGLVVKLSVNGAGFWLSGASEGATPLPAAALGGDSIRMILTVSNPDALFEQALKAGAVSIFPVGEEYGWRLGRLMDPFGLHWEIGYQL